MGKPPYDPPPAATTRHGWTPSVSRKGIWHARFVLTVAVKTHAVAADQRVLSSGTNERPAAAEATEAQEDAKGQLAVAICGYQCYRVNGAGICRDDRLFEIPLE